MQLYRQSSSETINNDDLNKAEAIPPTCLTALDIFTLLVPFLPDAKMQPTFDFVQSLILQPKSHHFQKRAYKSLNVLGSTHKQYILSLDDLKSFIEKTAKATSSANNKERILFLNTIIDILPPDQYDLFEVLLPEVVIGIKSINHKSRNLCFDIIVKIARKAHENSTDVDRIIMTISAGLASKSTTMIVATLSAISRLLFEFKGKILLPLINY
jgi:ribosomal RNA-processing protein 12